MKDIVSFTNIDLRYLEEQNIKQLREHATKGDATSQFLLAMCILYAQVDSSSKNALKYLESAALSNNVMALLMLAYIYEHAIGVEKNYTKSIDNYVKAYDTLFSDTLNKAKAEKNNAKSFHELKKISDSLVKKISSIVTTNKFCEYKDRNFVFEWTNTSRKTIYDKLEQVSAELCKFLNVYDGIKKDLKSDEIGKMEFVSHDLLQMPIEVIKTLVARDIINKYLIDNGFCTLPFNLFFNNALGRTLIDDDEKDDNDYIISGILSIAGHDDSPLWQYRAGLWYENCDNNLEPTTAIYWYEKCQGKIAEAKLAIERVKKSTPYQIINNTSIGDVDTCKELIDKSAKNLENNLSWTIEAALRGDVSSVRAIENEVIDSGKIAKIKDTSFVPYYITIENEKELDKEAIKTWSEDVKEEKRIVLEEKRRKEEEERRRKAEEERRKKEEEEKRRKAEEERRKKEEEEESLRNIEKEKLRKAEEERLRKEAEAEKRRQKAAEARRKKKEEEERLRKEEEERLRNEEEAEKRRQKAAEARCKKKEEEERLRKDERFRENIVGSLIKFSIVAYLVCWGIIGYYKYFLNEYLESLWPLWVILIAPGFFGAGVACKEETTFKNFIKGMFYGASVHIMIPVFIFLFYMWITGEIS